MLQCCGPKKVDFFGESLLETIQGHQRQ